MRNYAIYSGNIIKLKVNNIKVDKTNNEEKFENEEKKIKENSLAYVNRFGKLINLDYDINLPDYDEAYDYLENNIRNYSKNKYLDILYYKPIEYLGELSKEELELLKYYYENNDNEKIKKLMKI